MALTMWYRGIRFVKDFLVQYLNYIFVAVDKGNLLFTDGTKRIEFSAKPMAIKRASWDARNLPAVLVGKASGAMQYITFSKDLLKVDAVPNADGEHIDMYYTSGGNFDINIGLSVRARSIEERDNLVDIVGIYLSHPTTKDYFMNQYLLLPEAPKLAGESDIQEPKIEYPIYATEMSVRVVSRWQEYASANDLQLLDIISDVVAEENL